MCCEAAKAVGEVVQRIFLVFVSDSDDDEEDVRSVLEITVA